MPTDRVFLSLGMKRVIVSPTDVSAIEPDFTLIGEYSHGTDHDPLGYAVSHVLVHHVHDILRKHLQSVDIYPFDLFNYKIDYIPD